MNKLLYRTTGRFYLGRAEEQAQYVFQLRGDAPKELQGSFLVELEKDNSFSGSALEVAQDIKDVIDSYWINSDKPKIQALIEYLEIWEEKDAYEALVDRKKKLEEMLQKVDQELTGYDAEEMENWKPEVTA